MKNKYELYKWYKFKNNDIGLSSWYFIVEIECSLTWISFKSIHNEIIDLISDIISIDEICSLEEAYEKYGLLPKNIDIDKVNLPQEIKDFIKEKEIEIKKECLTFLRKLDINSLTKLSKWHWGLDDFIFDLFKKSKENKNFLCEINEIT